MTKNEKKEVRVSPRKGPKIDGSQFHGKTGLNKKHLELELLLEDGKEFTFASLLTATGEKYWATISDRLKLLCKERGYKLFKIRKERSGSGGPPRQVFKMLKLDGES